MLKVRWHVLKRVFNTQKGNPISREERSLMRYLILENGPARILISLYDRLTESIDAEPDTEALESISNFAQFTQRSGLRF